MLPDSPADPEVTDPHSNSALDRTFGFAAATLSTWTKVEDALAALPLVLREYRLADTRLPWSDIDKLFTQSHECSSSLARSALVHLRGTDTGIACVDALRKIASGDWSTIDSCLTNAGHCVTAIDAIRSELTACHSRIHEQHDAVSRLADDLGATSPALPPLQTLADAHEAERRLLEQHEHLKQQMTEVFAAARVEADAELAAIHASYDVSLLEGSWPKQFEDIKSQMESARTLQELTEVRSVLTTFRQNLTATPETQRLGTLVDLARAAEGAASKVVRVAQALIRRDRHAEALALLIGLQLSASFEASDMSDFSDFVYALLDATMGACSMSRNGLWWPEVVLSQPWLLALQQADLKQRAAFLQLVAILVLYQKKRNSTPEGLRSFMHGLKLDETLRQEETPVLYSIIEKIMLGHDVSIDIPAAQEAQEAASKEIEEFFHFEKASGYRTVASGGGDFRDMEQQQLMPRLRQLADSVKAACKTRDLETAEKLVAGTDPISLLDEACRTQGIAPRQSAHLVRKTTNPQDGYIPKLKARLKRYVDCVRNMPLHDIISVFKVDAEMESLANKSARTGAFWEEVRRSLADVAPVPDTTEFTALLPRLCNTEPAAMGLASTFIIAQCQPPPVAGESAGFETEGKTLLVEMLETLPETHYDRARVNVLLTERCSFHAWQLATIVPELQGEVPRLRHEAGQKEQGLRARAKELGLDTPSTREKAKLLHEWFEFRLFPAIEQCLDEIAAQQAQKRNREREHWLSSARHLLGQLNDARTCTEDPQLPEVLMQLLLDIIARIDSGLRIFMRAEPAEGWEAGLDRFTQWKQRLDFAIEHREYHIARELAEAIGITEAGSSPSRSSSDLRDALETLLSDDDLRRTEQALAAWGKLAKVTDATSANQIFSKEFVPSFCARARLYNKAAVADQSQKDGKWLRSKPIAHSLLQMATTRMHKPRNPWLNRPVALSLLPGPRPELDLVNALQDEMEDHDYLHIVFSPGCEKSKSLMHRHLGKKGIGFVIGPGDLEMLLREPSSEKAIRQKFLQGAQDTFITPFISEGYAHSEINLFAGRKGNIQKIKARPRTCLFGGRRIGKTSLVHAVRLDLEADADPWKTALVYASFPSPFQETETRKGYWDFELWRQKGETLKGQGDDPDLAMAKDIANKLDIVGVCDMETFTFSLRRFSETSRTAILIDEVDAYIRASRWFHGDQKFPLIRALRAVEQTTSGRMKVVLAGFKELFFESSRQVEEMAYPFKQWLAHDNVGPLKYEEARDFLIDEGLKDQLGFEFDSAISTKIFDFASGHPAFMQFFCNQLFERNQVNLRSGRRSLGMAEITAVYENAEATADSKTYLNFVAETLEMNLNALERSILLTIGLEFHAEGTQGKHIARTRIVANLKGFFSILTDVQIPDAHLEWAFSNLVMAGLLELKDQAYKLAYRSYFDILSRLNLDPKRNLDVAIKQYETMCHDLD